MPSFKQVNRLDVPTLSKSLSIWVHAWNCLISDSIEAAVTVFSKSRPPGIYKSLYIDELYKRYGDVDDTPIAPEQPDWCSGENKLLF